MVCQHAFKAAMGFLASRLPTRIFPFMRDLLKQPLWRPEDLGQPMPDSRHAVSVCLPTWLDNVGYEEGETRVIQALQTGYPRFVYHPLCRAVFSECERRFAGADEACLAWPSERVAKRFVAWLHQRTGVTPKTHKGWLPGFFASSYPRAVASEAKAYWQHSGEGISSRRAAAALGLAPEPLPAGCVDATAAKTRIRQHLGEIAGLPESDVFLFPIGMTAIFVMQRVLQRLYPGRPSVQFGFPYVDTLKVQEKFGPGVKFLPHASAADLAALQGEFRQQPLSGIFTEFPSNPLLISPDLAALSRLARQHGVPLIVDDTIATVVNVDLLGVADVICTSLTKSYSGVGDVTGGALWLNPHSPLHGVLRAALVAEYEDLLWDEDVSLLAHHGTSFVQRVHETSANAQALAAYLAHHPKVAQVYHPSRQTPELYRAFQRPGGGAGAMLSIILRDEAQAAPRFFNALRCCKGPNLGMDYTLVCPFTILAHYTELDWAERCGVSRYLMRVAVGREPQAELLSRFGEALDQA